MTTIADLWLPILITCFVVFFASSIMWMLLPHHKKDILFLKDKEAPFFETLNALNLTPGLYMYPGCDGADYKTDEGKAKWNAGPWGTLNVYPARPNFGMNLAKTFIAYSIITIMVAYITGINLAPGAEYMEVFRVAGTTAILGHCMGSIVGDTFLGKPKRFMITCFIDGLVYAMITAGILASMWPPATHAIDVIIPSIN